MKCNIHVIYTKSHSIDTKNVLTLEAHKIKIEFFTYPVLKEIIEQLMTRYFLLSEDDISSWESNPEEFGKCTHIATNIAEC